MSSLNAPRRKEGKMNGGFVLAMVVAFASLAMFTTVMFNSDSRGSCALAMLYIMIVIEFERKIMPDDTARVVTLVLSCPLMYFGFAYVRSVMEGILK